MILAPLGLARFLLLAISVPDNFDNLVILINFGILANTRKRVAPVVVVNLNFLSVLRPLYSAQTILSSVFSAQVHA